VPWSVTGGEIRYRLIEAADEPRSDRVGADHEDNRNCRCRPLGLPVHVFLSVPAGLAVMIGQMLNTFGPVQTYEHVPRDAVRVYEPAALLQPSA
jgi:hypothetical protein